MNEFVHIRVEDLHLDDESPQIYLTHAKREACRYVPVLPALAQELRRGNYSEDLRRPAASSSRVLFLLEEECNRLLNSHF